jgi:WD40 repeat protein/serine/threonine protein kinase
MTPPAAKEGETRPPRPAEERSYLLHYRLIEEIGRGGQGIVYLAEDRRTGRKCALKLLRDAGDISDDVLERLRREVEAAARLHHPGICAVHEAKLEGGSPYIAMNYVEGQSLAHQIGTALEPDDKTWRGLPGGAIEPDPQEPTRRTPRGPATREDTMRVALIIEKAALALHAAHEARVIHRDIKPSNIMVTPGGEPVVLDFGLAHFEESGLQALTRTGEIWGTPAYLSPEQLQGGKVKIDRRTDVWSLGVTLFECLTLKRPFEGPTNNLIFHAIQTKDPPDPCRLNKALPSDLRIVIDTALEKDRDRRYETALAFAEDLRAVREGRPIAARPVGPATRVTRWARRNPAVAASLLATFAILLTGIVVATSLVIALRSQMGEKNDAIQQAKNESEKRKEALQHSEGLRLLSESSAALGRDPGLAILLALEGASLAPDPPTIANGAANEALAELLEVRTLIGHETAVEGAELAPDGRRALTIAADGDVRLWDVAKGTLERRLVHPRANRAAFTPSGALVITLSSGARIWDAATGREVARLGEPPDAGRHTPASSHGSPGGDPADELLRGFVDGVRAVMLSVDGSRLLTIRGSEAAIWDPETGRRVSTLAGPVSDDAALNSTPDAARVLTITNQGATVWDGATGQEVASFRGPFPGVKLPRLSPDGRRVVAFMRDRGFILDCATEKSTPFSELIANVRSASFNADGTSILVLTTDGIHVADAETGATSELCGPASDPGAARELRGDLPQPEAAFTKDGKRIVGASCEGTARVYHAGTGEILQTLSGHAGDVRFVAASPDRVLVLTGSSTGAVIVRESVHWTETGSLRGHTDEINNVAFSRDGTFIVTASADRTARVWKARTPPGAPVLEGHRGGVGTILFGGKRALTASSDGHPRLWSLETFEQVGMPLGDKQSQSQPMLSPDGGLVLTLGEDGSRMVFDAATGATLATLRPGSSGEHMAFDPDSRRIVTASDEGIGYVWEAGTGREIARLVGHAGTINFVAFCAHGARIVTAADDRTVRLWNPDKGDEIREIPGHRNHVPLLSPDGGRIVVVSDTGEVVICDALTGEVVGRLSGPRQTAVRFSADGRRFATESADGGFRIWDAESYAAVATLPRDDGDRFHEFSPDGRLALSSSRDGTAHLFETATGRRIAEIRGAGSPLLDAAFSPDGVRIVLSSQEDTRVLDAATTADLWAVPRRHGAIKAVKFSPDGKWLAAGYAGGLTRLWPSNPLAKARELAPRELTLAELQAHGIEPDDVHRELRDEFEALQTNEELVATLQRREGLSDRLRRAAIAAALVRDRHALAERLRRRCWAEVVLPNLDSGRYALALQRAERALLLDPELPLGGTTLGAAQYRAGLHARALATLEKAARTSGSATNSIFIAMVHARLGERDQAATALAGARRLLELGGAGYPDEVRRLLAEADALLAPESRPR